MADGTLTEDKLKNNIHTYSPEAQKLALIHFADKGDTEGLEAAFEKLKSDGTGDYEDQIMVILTSLAEDLTDNVYDDKLDEDAFQNIFDSAMAVLPER